MDRSSSFVLFVAFFAALVAALPVKEEKKSETKVEAELDDLVSATCSLFTNWSARAV